MGKTLNRVFLVGWVGEDPTIKFPAQYDGTSRAVFSLATGLGRQEDKTQWHRVLVWENKGQKDGGLFGIVRKYVKKGMQVHVEGRLQYRSWEDRDGVMRYTTEIVAKSVILLSKFSS